MAEVNVAAGEGRNDAGTAEVKFIVRETYSVSSDISVSGEASV